MGENKQNQRQEEVIEPEVITEVEEVNNINKKAIATIGNKLVEARYSLTIEEQRIILALISLIQPEDEDFKDYKISVKALAEAIGTKHKNMYKVLDEATDRLMQRVLKVETIDEKTGKKAFEKFSFISYAKYVEGEGYLIISIEKRLKPYLLKLKEKFTKIPLKYIFPLRSRYAIRLYELLKQYEETGFRVDKVEDLREKLGVEENEYTRFVDFEKRVLKQAVKEINEKTDLEVSYIKKKTGRRITHIEFEINPKEGDTTQTTKSPSQSLDIQRQKKAIKNHEDLWKGVIKILANKYDLTEEEYEILALYTYAKYKTDTNPKIMAICTDIAVEKGKQVIRDILNKYSSQIVEIVKIETNGNYKVAICKNLTKQGEQMPI